MGMTRKPGKKVAPISGKAIRERAQNFRDVLLQKKPFVKVTALLEALQDMEFLEFEVVEDFVLGDDEARSYPDKKFMQIKQTIYDRAHEGDGHCRFTIAHELGHLLMHRGQESYARGSGSHEVYEDSEWQADLFASEFLIDQRLIRPTTGVYEIKELFGVSLSAAEYRLKRYRKGK